MFGWGEMRVKMKRNRQERAVSPVIGVILMVAITVILAAVIGTFVLGLGEEVEENVRAGVNADVENAEDNVTITVTTMGNADYILLRGGGLIAEVVDGSSQYQASIVLNNTGESVRLGRQGSSLDGFIKREGTITVVGMKGDLENTYSSVWTEGNTYIDSSMTGIRSGDRDIAEGATLTTIQTIEYDFT